MLTVVRRLILHLPFLAAFIFALAGSSALQAYVIGTPWPSDTTKITVYLAFFRPAVTLQDGSASWEASARDALRIWNTHLDSLAFEGRSGAGGGFLEDEINAATFSKTIYGEPFSPDTLAVTLTFREQNRLKEADVIFNDNKQWNSYRGPKQGSGTSSVFDFHRVALHEFGHVLGLRHPDEAGQTVAAIMNSAITDLDALAQDDIDGALSLYGPTTATAVLGSSFQYQIAIGGSPTSYSASGLPPGLECNGSTGLISGVPTISGTFPVNIVAATASGNVSKTLLIIVNVPPPASPGQQVASFNVKVDRFAVDPRRPRVYASLPDAGSVIVIDTDSLAIIRTIRLGTRPRGLTVSADGSRLWVADAGSAATAIGVIDLESLAALPALSAPSSALDVAEGLDQRLYAASTGSAGVSGIMAIDSRTGALLGSFGSLSNGVLAMTPDRATLYAGDRGVSPSNLRKFDVSTPQAALLQTSTFGALGSNGKDLQVSRDGTFLCFPTGSGNGNGYSTRKISSADLNAFSGVFNTGAFPSSIALSGDDNVLYHGIGTTNRVAIFDTHTFAEIGSITVSPSYEVSAMAVNNTGALLFVATPSSSSPSAGLLQVFTTGRQNQTGAPPIPAKTLLNVSTRLRAQTGDGALIGGFIITGNQSKRILARAIGPSLPVPGRMADPILELRDSTGALVAANDNWNSARTAILATNTPPTDERESAIVATLAPGAYTAVVRGVGGASGVALVELYDLRPASAQIANISTRGKVEVGDEVMIGGFILGGDQATRVIVRAIGPSLASQGVNGALADTTLTLYNGNGAQIAENDDWRSDQEAEVTATGVPPPDSLESAIVRTLPSGNYTAIVRGKGAATGAALVEVYNLETN